MFEDSLKKAGLSKDQAKVYELLLKKGHLQAGQISKDTGLKRGQTYKILSELEALALTKKHDKKGQVAFFEPLHPARLKELAEAKEADAKIAQTALSVILPELSSSFNLISNKPGVQFYEGRTAILKIAQDSLSATEAILTYVDNEAIDQYAFKENEHYVRQRIAKGIRKKMLSPDSKYIRDLAPELEKTLIEARVIPPANAFHSVVQIYNNKISYLTLSQDSIVGIIIEDKAIAQMNKTIFENLWAKSEPITKPLKPRHSFDEQAGLA